VWGIGCLAPRILNRGTRYRPRVSFTLGRFTPVGGSPGTHWIGGWVGPTSGLDAVAKRKKNLHLQGITPVIHPVA